MIRLRGETAHAAQPETGRSPARAMCRLIESLGDLAQSPVAADEHCAATVVGARLGDKAFGTAPGEAAVWVTLRSESDATMARLVGDLERQVEAAADADGLASEVAYEEVFAATVNSPLAVELVRMAAGERVVRTLARPFRWSEDFGCLSAAAGHSALFGLGAGEETPALHNPGYDFPDALIPIAADLFWNLIEACAARPVPRADPDAEIRGGAAGG